MADQKVETKGTQVVIETSSSAVAKEIAAKAEYDLLRMDGTVAGIVRTSGVWIRNVAQEIGKGTFEAIAWLMLGVGCVVAYLSWGRLMPDKDLGGVTIGFLVGLIGAALVVWAKVAAGRCGLRHNEAEAALKAGDKELADRKRQRAGWLLSIVIVLVVIDALVAAAFGAAVMEDGETGRIDYAELIADAEADARKLDREADEMPRDRDDIGLLRQDLDRFLKSAAYNNAGEPTPLTRAEVIGWGVTEAGLPLEVPGEAYCMPGGNYASYVDRYCEDAAELHRKVVQKQAWLDKLATAEAKRQEAQRLREERPEAASGLAIADQLGERGQLLKYIPYILLMAVILMITTGASYFAKRDLEGD